MLVALKASRCVLFVFILLTLFEASAEARRIFRRPLFFPRFRQQARFVPRMRVMPQARSMPARSCGSSCGVVQRPNVGQSDIVFDDTGIGGVVDPSDGQVIQDDVLQDVVRPGGGVRSGGVRSSSGTCGVRGGGHAGSCGVVSPASPRPLAVDSPVLTDADVAGPLAPPLFANAAGEHPIGGVINPAQASRPVLPEQVAPVAVPPPVPAPNQPLVCSDPKKAICGDPSTRVEEEKKIAAKRIETVKQALAASGQTADGLTNGKELNLSGYRQYISRLSQLVEKRNISATIKEVRDSLRSAIRLSAPPEVQGAMIAKLEAVTPVSYSQLALERPEYLSAFLLTCGPDGLSNNAAFFEKGPNGTPIKAICPAYLSEDAKPEDLFGTLAHEDGHSIDAGRFPAFFTNLLACYQEKYKGFSRQLGGEATADFWMQQAVAIKMAGSTPETMLNYAKVVLGDYCLPAPRLPAMKFPEALKANLDKRRANPVHPADDFRIDAFARNPEIRKIFKCTNSTSKTLETGPPVCGLSGAI